MRDSELSLTQKEQLRIGGAHNQGSSVAMEVQDKESGLMAAQCSAFGSGSRNAELPLWGFAAKPSSLNSFSSRGLWGSSIKHYIESKRVQSALYATSRQIWNIEVPRSSTRSVLEMNRAQEARNRGTPGSDVMSKGWTRGISQGASVLNIGESCVADSAASRGWRPAGTWRAEWHEKGEAPWAMSSSCARARRVRESAEYGSWKATQPSTPQGSTPILKASAHGACRKLEAKLKLDESCHGGRGWTEGAAIVSLLVSDRRDTMLDLQETRVPDKSGLGLWCAAGIDSRRRRSCQVRTNPYFRRFNRETEIRGCELDVHPQSKSSTQARCGIDTGLGVERIRTRTWKTLITYRGQLEILRRAPGTRAQRANGGSFGLKTKTAISGRRLAFTSSIFAEHLAASQRLGSAARCWNASIDKFKHGRAERKRGAIMETEGTRRSDPEAICTTQLNWRRDRLQCTQADRVSNRASGVGYDQEASRTRAGLRSKLEGRHEGNPEGRRNRHGSRALWERSARHGPLSRYLFVPSERCGKCAREEARAEAFLESKSSESYAGPRGSAGTSQGRRGRKVSSTSQGVVREQLLCEKPRRPGSSELAIGCCHQARLARECTPDGADGAATGGRHSGLHESDGGVEAPMRTVQHDSSNSGGEEPPRGELDSATALVTTRTPLSSIHNEELVIIERRPERSAKRMKMGGKRWMLDSERIDPGVQVGIREDG
ncbi:hypothetical protein DFH08DRAFT_798346 [Mycena albidolilacea]|uniref:Uncharacterized protein n=1 Tax=Mycena albidolilacea TaxID=1033008 RepID=A0AAD7AND0_9AGAR|nr:hypothetical protein DFH08DRAFT_798346 [Mycena albidolilacea]